VIAEKLWRKLIAAYHLSSYLLLNGLPQAWTLWRLPVIAYYETDWPLISYYFQSVSSLFYGVNKQRCIYLHTHHWFLNTITAVNLRKKIPFFSYGITAHIWALSSTVLRFLNHTQLDTRKDFSGWVIRPPQRPLPTQDNTIYKHRGQTSMPSAGFESVIQATKWPQS
jgi:hypothetical protein